MQACIKPPPIPLVKLELDRERAIQIIKVNIQRNPTSAASEIYNINMSTFNNGQTEEFLALLKNFKIVVYGTGMTSLSCQINYIRAMLHGQALGEFEEIVIQNNGSNNNHLNLIMEGLLGYLFPINAFSNQKCAVRYAMRKPQNMTFKIFAARLT